MASKSKKPAATQAEKFPRKAIACESGPSDDEKGRAYASLINSPELAAHRIVGMMQPKVLADGIDTPTMLATLRDQAAAVQGGDLGHAEAMLINQASALQAVFVRLSERAMDRATLETLAAIKNPPIVYARQANVTTGPQQINNGTAAPSQAREMENEQTQLSGGTHELLPDTRATGEASRTNPTLEALGEIDRAEVRRG